MSKPPKILRELIEVSLEELNAIRAGETAPFEDGHPRYFCTLPDGTLRFWPRIEPYKYYVRLEPR